MRKSLFSISLILLFLACEIHDDSEFCYHEFQHAFVATLFFSGELPDTVLLYHKFNNTSSEEVVSSLYWTLSEELLYAAQVSVLDLLSERKNQIIPDALILKSVHNPTIKLVKDYDSSENIVFLSEPFMIDENKYCFSILKRVEGNKLYWFGFIKREIDTGRYMIYAAYDLQKDILYGVYKPSELR